MANAYKSLKEDFVSNHSGGSISEITFVTAIAPAAYLLWAALQSQQSFFRIKTSLTFLVDFLINVGGLLLAVTLYSSMPGVLLALFVSPAILLLALPASKVPAAKPSLTAKADMKPTDLPEYPRRPFLTAYRGGMLVITSIAILAVDFKVFPRRFAKVETWGTSLMDIGVGSFVFAAGLASSKSFYRARKPSNESPRATTGIFGQVVTSLRQSLPLLVLGGARLVSVKNLDYAEHVSEYGVHWNFFFTLAVIPLGLLFLQPLLSVIPGLSYGYMAIILAALYEITLQTTGLKAWALTAPRTDLLSQNKEGLCSCIGYLAIFLLGIETGSIVLPRHIPQNGMLARILRGLGIASNSRLSLLASLGILFSTYSALLLAFYNPRILPWLSIPVSRRLANAPYLLWTGAYNTGQLFLFALVESVVFPSVHRATSLAAEKQTTTTAISEILDDYNSGGLIVFLLANLGTGLVNLSIDTLKVGNTQAVGILFVYMGILTILARFTRGIKIKL